MKRAAFATTFACVVLSRCALPAEAHAAGAAFFEAGSSAHVTGHRVAIAISSDQTVLWDELRYAGDPRDFALVVPLPQGAVVELGNDAFISALDAYTAPTIFTPRDSDTSGCALMGCVAKESTTPGTISSPRGSPSAALAAVPYELTTVAPANADELLSLLTKSGLGVPAGTSAIVADYIAQGLSFALLRFRPGCGEQTTVPVRIVIPGSRATVPLRLAGIGAGDDAVGIEVFALGDRRWAPASYPEGAIDFGGLRADDATNNYEDLADAVFAAGQGRTFITEFAGPPGAATIDDTDLATTFAALCAERPTASDAGTCIDDLDASDPYFDGAAIDASDIGAMRDGSAEPDGSEVDASDDASDDAGDAGAGMMLVPRFSHVDGNTASTCASPTDLSRATDGTSYAKLYLARMRARVPASQLASTDLTLTPSMDGDVSQYHQAIATPTGAVPQSSPGATCRAAPRGRPRASLAAIVAALACAGAMIARRRGRR